MRWICLFLIIGLALMTTASRAQEDPPTPTECHKCACMGMRDKAPDGSKCQNTCKPQFCCCPLPEAGIWDLVFWGGLVALVWRSI